MSAKVRQPALFIGHGVPKLLARDGDPTREWLGRFGKTLQTSPPLGAWLPLAFLFPEADLPIVEVSLQSSLDPEAHFALGRALEPLRDEGIIILGSGSLTHDLGDHERISSNPDADDVLGAASRRFETWVTDLLTNSAPYARARGLTRFRDHPDARAVHANGEHLLPLVVVAGAASKDMPYGNQGVLVHAGSQRGLSMAALSFGP